LATHLQSDTPHVLHPPHLRQVDKSPGHRPGAACCPTYRSPGRGVHDALTRAFARRVGGGNTTLSPRHASSWINVGTRPRSVRPPRSTSLDGFLTPAGRLSMIQRGLLVGLAPRAGPYPGPANWAASLAGPTRPATCAVPCGGLPNRPHDLAALQTWRTAPSRSPTTSATSPNGSDRRSPGPRSGSGRNTRTGAIGEVPLQLGRRRATLWQR